MRVLVGVKLQSRPFSTGAAVGYRRVTGAVQRKTPAPVPRRNPCRLVATESRSQSEALHWNCKHISDTALSLDDARRTRIALELPAQSQNLDVNAAVEYVFVHPGCL